MVASERRAGAERGDNDRVFILRFWIERESTPHAVPLWRAKVSDVVSGEECHLNGVEPALEHVRKLMEAKTT